MIDLDKIGKRIQEQRKHIMHISQERFAEDLGIYQADVSNLEKAKKGSGITDLLKLDLIAEYFGIPLETLLFGMEDKNMLKYHGTKMQLKRVKKKSRKQHMDVLKKLVGSEETITPQVTFECGPYIAYVLMEKQYSIRSIQKGGIIDPEFSNSRAHIFVFYGAECISKAVADVTSIMQHVFYPSFELLTQNIPFDVLDVTDVWRTMNPYWALWRFSEEGSAENSDYKNKMLERMTALRQYANKNVLYVESIYVREDCRQNGICRLCIDIMKDLFENPVMWFNMEPTSGAELNKEYTRVPAYTVSDVGQLNLNAYIAERLGLIVDPDTWHRQAEVFDEDGNEKIETILVRKCSYFMPKEIREITKNDDGLVALGRAKQRIVQNNAVRPGVVDYTPGYVGEEFAYEIKYSNCPDAHCTTALLDKKGEIRYVISYASLIFSDGKRIISEFSSKEESIGTEYEDEISMADLMLRSVCAIKKDENGHTYLVPATKDKNISHIIKFDCLYDEETECVYAESKVLISQENNIFYIFGEKDCDGERYAVAMESVLAAFEKNDDSDVATIEEYTSYEATEVSVHTLAFDEIRKKLVEKWEAVKGN